MKKSDQFFKVPAITQKEADKYVKGVKIPKKYPSQFISIKKMLQKVSK